MVSRVETTPLALTGAGISFPARERAARVLGAVVFWALLALVPLTAVPYGTVDEWSQSLFQCVVLAAAALWSVEGMLSWKWFVREHWLLAPLVPLLLFVFAQSVPLGVEEVAGVRVWRTVSASPFETRLVAFRFLALLLFAALLLRYTSSRRRLCALVCCVAGLGVASALFGVVQQATHPAGDEFFLARLLPQLSYGQFINKNHFAFLMEMCLGLLLGLLAGTRRRGGQTFLCLAGVSVIWSALVLSSSRGGIMAMLGQVVLFALSYRAARSPRRARSGAASLTRRSILAVAARCCVYPRRAHIWQATLRMIAEHPVVGSGFGGYYLAIDRYYDASGVSAPREAHNDYLELLSSGGGVCVAPVVCSSSCSLGARAGACIRAGLSAGLRAWAHFWVCAPLPCTAWLTPGYTSRPTRSSSPRSSSSPPSTSKSDGKSREAARSAGADCRPAGSPSAHFADGLRTSRRARRQSSAYSLASLPRVRRRGPGC